MFSRARAADQPGVSDQMTIRPAVAGVRAAREPKALDRPILVLASGQRCGSTWLQRILSTHPHAFIWGEHHGQIAHIFEATERLAQWADGAGKRAAKEFAAAGTDAFMANITPSEPVMREQTTAFVRGLFGRLPDGTAAPAGYRWGFKEVRYGADFVRRFAYHFPATRVIHLARDPVAVLRSLDWWERVAHGTWAWSREDTVSALTRWRDINASFLAATDLTDTVRTIRYEQLAESTERTLDRICEFLDIESVDLDLNRAKGVVHSSAPWGHVTRELRSRAEVVHAFSDLLTDAHLRRVAGELGYSVEV